MERRGFLRAIAALIGLGPVLKDTNELGNLESFEKEVRYIESPKWTEITPGIKRLRPLLWNHVEERTIGVNAGIGENGLGDR